MKTLKMAKMSAVSRLETPICHIVPVSCALKPLPHMSPGHPLLEHREKSQGSGGKEGAAGWGGRAVA